MNGGVVNNPCPKKGNAVLWIRKMVIIVSVFLMQLTDSIIPAPYDSHCWHP
jgi:hypothetical protein